MGRLDELDLSLKLSKKEEAERLEAAQKRMGALRLALGGKLDGEDLGPPVRGSSRAGTRPARAARSNA